MKLPTLTLHKRVTIGNTYFDPACKLSKTLIKMLKKSTGQRVTYTEGDVEILKEAGFSLDIKEPKVTYE